MDLSAGENSTVYIDVQPASIDGNQGLNVYRVVAGDVMTWSSGSENNQYQIFGIHVQKTDGSWENYAWIIVGHVDAFRYLTPETIIAGPTSGRSTIAVADVAAAGTWATHVHLEAYNYDYIARTYNWDGPSNADQPGLPTAWGPACTRVGSQTRTDCETEVLGTDVVGYVGGNKPSFAQVANPYYLDF